MTATFLSAPYHAIANNFLFAEIKRLSTLYRPYFGLEGENLYRTLGAVAIIVFSLLSGRIMININENFELLNEILMFQGSSMTLGVFFHQIINCLIPISVYGIVMAINLGITSWISDSLTNALSKDLISKWIDDKSYYGIQFLNKKDKKINPGVILGEDLSAICSTSLSLATAALSSLSNFIFSFRQLILMSTPLVVSIASMTITIPAYMVLAAVGYSFVYSFIIHLLDKNLKDILSSLKDKKDALSAHLHHVHENAESIALRKGGAKERKGLISYLQAFSDELYKKRVIDTLLGFFQGITIFLPQTLALVLSAPAIIAQKIDASKVFSLSNYFSSVTSFFTFKRTYTSGIESMNVSLTRFELFKELMQEWDKIKNPKELVYKREKNKLSVSRLTVSKPDGELIFDNAVFDIPYGKATVIQGPSGVGKTTLFRSLAGLWPFVKGEIILPAKSKNAEVKIFNIPQKPYFPYKGSLIDAIMYPSEKAPTRKERTKIIALMKELHLGEDKINNLDKEWEGNLSGGEEQRIAVIGAILKRPDILFMDEGTNGLDYETKLVTENALKAHLKNTTIVAIDHQSEIPINYKPFFDYKLRVDKTADQERSDATIRLSLFKG